MTAAAEAPPLAPPPRRRDSTFATLRDLWPYMWPSSRPDLKRRVVLALAVRVAAKIVTVLVPYTYKWATDALTAPPQVGADGAVTVVTEREHARRAGVDPELVLDRDAADVVERAVGQHLRHQEAGDATGSRR